MTDPREMTAPAPGQPAVGYETQDANIRVILITAGILAASVTVICLAVWGLYVYFDEREMRARTTGSPLAKEEQDRLPPPPRLEGFEPVGAYLFVSTPSGARKFYVDTPITVRQKVDDYYKDVGLFDLREGTEVSVSFNPAEGRDWVVAVYAPPREPAAPPSVTGKIEKIDPRGVTDRDEWAKQELSRYGWQDKQKGIARIPIDRAIQVIADKKLGPTGAEKEGTAPGRARPSVSNSGRGPVEGRR
jgi:hypothetical protein